jgi:hypothetical protein
MQANRGGLTAAGRPAPSPMAGRKIMILQLDATGFVEQGIEKLLDTVRERAGVNGLLLDSFWFSRNEGGYMGAIHPQYYKDIGVQVKDLWSPKGTDVLAGLTGPTRQRGMTRTSIIKDMVPDELPGREKLCERDFNGAQAETTCKNNPYYRNLVLGAVEDAIRSYDVDGIMYMAERQGAFGDTLGMRFRGKERGRPGSRTCFCEFCRARAARLGIRFERARRGFEDLDKFVSAGRMRKRPADGYYTALWRLMLRHPELLAWEHLWHESYRELLRLLHDKVKVVRPTVQFGSHIWPNHSMNPVFRAEQNLAEMAPYHDFIKFPLYYNCGGPRMASYIESVSETVWGDVPPHELLQFHYRVLNYDEAPYEDLRQAGLYRSYVYRESKRAMDGASGTAVKILPGIEIDIPLLRADLGGTSGPVARCTREGVRDIIKQAFRAEVPGVIISREYTEMKLDNLSGVGDAIRELDLRT